MLIAAGHHHMLLDFGYIGHCITRIPPHNSMYTIVGVLAKILPGARFSQAAGPWMQTAEAPKETKDWSLMG